MKTSTKRIYYNRLICAYAYQSAFGIRRLFFYSQSVSAFNEPKNACCRADCCGSCCLLGKSDFSISFLSIEWEEQKKKRTEEMESLFFYSYKPSVFFRFFFSLLFLLRRLLILLKPNIYYDYCYDFIICLLFKFNAKTIMIRIKASTSPTAFHFGSACSRIFRKQ